MAALSFLLLFLLPFTPALAQNATDLPNSTALHNYGSSNQFSDKITDLAKSTKKTPGSTVSVALVTIGGYDPSLAPSANATGTQGWRFVYQSVISNEVDNYALLDVVYSNEQEWLQEPDTYFRVEIGPIVSPWRRRNEGSFVVPFWTVIATCEDGTLTKLEWDDFANDCTTIIEGNCAVETNTCIDPADTATADGNNCDLKTYIGWSGTDINGNYMTSAGQTISSFRQWSVAAYYDDAVEGVGDIPDQIPTKDELKDEITG